MCRLTGILSAEPQFLCNWSPSCMGPSSRADLGTYADARVAPTPRKLLKASVVFFTRTLSEPIRRKLSLSVIDELKGIVKELYIHNNV